MFSDIQVDAPSPLPLLDLKQRAVSPKPCSMQADCTGNESWDSSACSVRCAKQFVEFQRHLSNRRKTWLQLPDLYMRNKYFCDSLQFSRPESRGFIAHKIKKPLLWSFIQRSVNEGIQSPAPAHSEIFMGTAKNNNQALVGEQIFCWGMSHSNFVGFGRETTVYTS